MALRTTAALLLTAALGACAGSTPADDRTAPTQSADADTSTSTRPRGDCTVRPASNVRTVRYAATPGVAATLQSLDVWVPERTGDCEPAPLVVWVHGGGFTRGDKANAMAAKVAHLTGGGAVLASVNYRLVGDPRSGPDGAAHPHQVDDVAAAVAWLVEHAEELDADPARISLLGHSAGAYLVALVGADPAPLAAAGVDPAALACVVVVDTEGFVLADLIADGGRGARMFTDAFGTDPAMWDAASPELLLDDDQPLPRFLFVTRGVATRRARTQAMADAITDAGGAAEVLVAEGLSHSEVNDVIGRADDSVVTPAIDATLAQCD